MVRRQGGKFYGCPAFFPFDEKRNPNGYKAELGQTQCRGTIRPSYKSAPIVRQPRKQIVGSDQQIAIWEEMKNGDTHIMVKALAGTGKTTTIEVGSYDMAVPMRAVAFSRKIERELKSRMPERVDVSTFHALGLRIIAAYADKKINVEEGGRKTFKIIESLQIIPVKMKDNEAWQVKKAIAKLVALCKNRLAEPTKENLNEMLTRYAVDISVDPSLILDAVPRVLDVAKTMITVIDMEDMLWLPIVHNMPFPQVACILVDEVQDTNPARTEMIFRCCPTGRIIIVGDENQAIMGFTGSDTEAMDNLEKRLSESPRGLTVLGLTKTRRCPKSHVALAQSHVPNFEALDDAPEGEIGEYNFVAAVDAISQGDMVQCRNNAPLAKICWKLLKRHLKVQIAGKRDFGSGLIDLIERMRASDVPQLIERIEEYRGKELAKCEKMRNAEYASEAINDKCDCLIAFTEGTDSVKALITLIKTIYADSDEAGIPKNAVLLTTTHKAKGLEADTVWILDPSLYPSKAAKQEWELKQEHNLIYVRDTRSKSVLNFIKVD
jgi:DNA helicase-2/ATP-dependent DNA helicase PcrA